jgi:glucose/mannose-6-phosphate isomerase
MMDLNDVAALVQLDHEGMFGHVAALPRQCRDAWALTRHLELPPEHLQANKVVVAGMGGSAIGGDLAAAVAADSSAVPILIHRDYELPAHVDRQTLVVGSSYSGNTEETLSAFQAARERGCPLVAITTGGELARLAREWRVPFVAFDFPSPPRAALGHLLVSLLGVLRALGAVDDLSADLEEAVALLEAQSAKLAPDIPLAQNQAKQLARALHGHLPIVVGVGPLSPVARRWKTQFNENSKAWACFEALPEMDHNALTGIHFPGEMAPRVRVLFLGSGALHPRNKLRLDLTRQILESQDVACHQVDIPGESSLSQILAAVQLGDYVSCYLAALYGADPTDIEDIIGLKRRMSRQMSRQMSR